MTSVQPVVMNVPGTGGAWNSPDDFTTQVATALGTVNDWQVVTNLIDGHQPPTAPYYWQGIGYPAAVFPMGPSVDAGVTEVVRQWSLRPPGTPVALVGWSQGAIVTGKVWRDQILNPAGRLNDRLSDVVGIVNFGDPLRCPGIAHGNTIAGLPQPTPLDGQTTGGIAGKGCLTPDQTPDFLLSCALDGDLYACAPIGDKPWTAEPGVGADETVIFDLVQNFTFATITELAARAAQILARPLPEIIALAEAIINGLTFAVQGMNAPHWQYGPFVPAVTAWLNQRATAHRLATAA